KIGFNLELFPPLFIHKTWYTENDFGLFPRQANGAVRSNLNNKIIPLPLARGKRFSIAADDPLHHLVLESMQEEIELYDGRIPDNNGWFILRTLVPAGKTKDAVHLLIRATVQDRWLRSPQILCSQAGYHPDQNKRAVIELDRNSKRIERAQLYRLEADGSETVVLSQIPKRHGNFLRYNYLIFDFTDISRAGLYVIRYEHQTSDPFIIAEDVYDRQVWQPTLETFFPVQMCHMEIRDRFRIWHGLCHRDDALQAPTSHDHFDGYRQGAKTETRYRPYDPIPGLNIGGWHDAGDYDLATGNQAETTYLLSLLYETFRPIHDQTSVNQKDQIVELHKPDGRNDFIQQIEHGVYYLLAPYKTGNHSFIGIICPTLEQYVHLGDAMTMTDNQVFLRHEENGVAAEHRRGRMDDRWAFTNRDSGLEYKVAATLAAAARALAEDNPQLAQECRARAEGIWQSEENLRPAQFAAAYVPDTIIEEKILAAIELFKTTKSEKYRRIVLRLTPDIQATIERTGWAAVRVFEELNDDAFDHSLFRALRSLCDELNKTLNTNPFGVPFDPHIWGVGWDIQKFAVGQYFLHKAFPELFDRENLFNVVHFILGCHPGSSTSFVSGVGVNSMTTAYGFNRADESYIPGGVVSGVALIQPDFPELKESWPYIWQQSEYVINGAASYLFCMLAADDLLRE
ncbi:MAG: glycoside hydrolase, partial [Calditrichaeota bacterium]